MRQENKRRKRKEQSSNKRPHPKAQNAQWGALRGKTRNRGSNVIIINSKQVVQQDERKIWKDTKCRRGLSSYHN